VVDSDGDGVPDSSDACPNTPAGVVVDSRGCPLDSDGDGVPDYLDKCPNTPRGTKVDATGCPIPVATTFDLTVEFAFNSAEINDLSFRELRKAMTFMREHPEEKALVEGTPTALVTISTTETVERRADAVKGVLVVRHDSSRITTVGYGETRPVASTTRKRACEEPARLDRRSSADIGPWGGLKRRCAYAGPAFRFVESHRKSSALPCSCCRFVVGVFVYVGTTRIRSKNAIETIGTSISMRRCGSKTWRFRCRMVAAC
jgi:OOP family OmpA-OmpF porin